MKVTLALLQAQRTFGNEASRGRKEQTLQNDVAALESALESAKAELTRIASRNREVSLQCLAQALSLFRSSQR